MALAVFCIEDCVSERASAMCERWNTAGGLGGAVSP